MSTSSFLLSKSRAKIHRLLSAQTAGKKRYTVFLACLHRFLYKVSMSDPGVLKSCALFSGFSETGLLVLSKITQQRSIPAGTPIFVENMVAESMFIIKQGEVSLSIKDEKGKDHALEIISGTEAFGELSLLIGGQRMVTATAVSDCELLEISRRDFAKLQKQKPQACLKLMIKIVANFGKKISNCREYLKPILLSQLMD